MSDESFRRSQQDTEMVRRLIQELKGEVRATVKEEVRHVGYSNQEMRDQIREMVRAEIVKQHHAAMPPMMRWAPTILAVVISVLIFAGGTAIRERLARSQSESDTPITRDVQPTEIEQPTREEPTDDYEVLAAEFTRGFETNDRQFTRLIEQLTVDGKATAKVRAAAREYLTKRGDSDELLLRSAMIQHIAANKLDPTLVIDGDIRRSPCRGSCTKVLELWTNNIDALGASPIPNEIDPAQLSEIERALIVLHLEKRIK